VTIDPADLPWSPERLRGLANVLYQELEARGVDVNDPVAIKVAEAMWAFIVPRAAALTTLDVIDAMGNVFDAAAFSRPTEGMEGL
jgi:hypothetical protein